jgi:hypothetical protein
LYDNLLTDNPNDFVARVASERSLNIDDICKSAVSRGGADISAQAMAHSTELFLKEMAYLINDGYSINTGYFTAGMQIKGVFNNKAEAFNAEKHQLLVQFGMGETVRKSLADVQVDILGVAETGIEILEVTDVKTGLVNSKITPSRNLRIKGSKLKIAGTNATVGVYFINKTTAKSIKVDATDIVTNNPSELVIVTPALPAGTYKLQITTQFTNSVLLKEPRTVIFDKLLTVGGNL